MLLHHVVHSGGGPDDGGTGSTILPYGVSKLVDEGRKVHQPAQSRRGEGTLKVRPWLLLNYRPYIDAHVDRGAEQRGSCEH